MATDQKPLPYSPCVASAMRKASRRLTQLYDDALKPSRLRSTQYTILYEIERRSKEAPTMAELASVLAMDRSTLGHNLRPLEREGLINLRADAEDHRQRRVALTARGKARFRNAEPFWQAAQDQFDKVFGEAEAADLRATLLGIAFEERLTSLPGLKNR
jgi:DNA-binding MarR family transcriptional regulator